MTVYVTQFVLALLLFVRVTSVLVTAPVFGHQAIPVQAKVAVGLFLALTLYPMNAHHAAAIDVNLIPLAVAVAREVLVGVVIGFAVSIIFYGVKLAGDIISFDMGFSIANVIDPESGQHLPVVAELLYLVTLLIFLLLNGHHFVIEAIQLSYAAVPLGEFVLGGAVVESLIRLTASMFVVAVKIAAPVIVAVFLTNVVLAVLARVMPQMNIFTVSFPLKIGVGLFMLAATGPLMIAVFKKALAGFQEDVAELVKLM